MAKILPISHDITPHSLQTIVDCLRANGVVALATESFYALSAGVQSPQAIERVVRMKGDRQGKPILVLVSSKEQASQVVSHISVAGELLMDRFWPGPLTLVLPSISGLPLSLTGGTSTIGVRQPGRHQLLQLLEVTGPLTGTSANRSNMPAARTSEEILQVFGDEVDIIVDSGPSPGGEPSTILEVVEEVRLLRQGAIPVAEVQEALGSYGLQVQDSGQ